MMLPILALGVICEGFAPRQTSIVSKASPWHRLVVNNEPTVIQRRSSLKLFYQDDEVRDTTALERQRDLERQVNNFLRASQRSFQNVESMTDGLLTRQPLVALALFVGAGAFVAYLSGLIFLGGYIETWNPVENDAVPYWDEEILIITRKVGR